MEIPLNGRVFEINVEKGNLTLKGIDLEAEKIAAILIDERCGAVELSQILKKCNYWNFTYRNFVEMAKIGLLKRGEYVYGDAYRNLNVMGKLVMSYSTVLAERLEVAANNSTPGWILHSLLWDKVDIVELQAASNGNLPHKARIAWLKRRMWSKGILFTALAQIELESEKEGWQ